MIVEMTKGLTKKTLTPSYNYSAGFPGLLIKVKFTKRY